MPKPSRGFARLRGERVLLVGCGRESTALARKLLADNPNQVVHALDGRPGDAVEAWREEFGPRVPVFVRGDASDQVPDEVASSTIAVVSPGVPRTGELYQWVVALGIPYTSGNALFVDDHRDTMVGVTGSKGKSTTSALTHHLLVHSGVQAALAGNMGIPVHGIDPADFYVVELSSYQCHYLEHSPGIVVLTALFPEHLDWHGSEQAYYDDKLSIAQDDSAVVIANADNEVLVTQFRARYPDRDVIWVGAGHPWHLEPDDEGGSWLVHGSKRLAHTRSLNLVGKHNHQNALLAVVAASTTGLLSDDMIESAFSSFSPLPHRLQVIEDSSGVKFVNDSLATNPHATVSALQALTDGRVILLVGGADRGVDYQVLVDQVVATPPMAILGLPDSGQRLIDQCGHALAKAGLADVVVLEAVPGMIQAVARSRELARAGDYVVLSPAAPSFGHYRDYAHRAEDFLNSIEQTKEGV